jgi:hypothetical protein
MRYGCDRYDSIYEMLFHLWCRGVITSSTRIILANHKSTMDDIKTKRVILRSSKVYLHQYITVEKITAEDNPLYQATEEADASCPLNLRKAIFGNTTNQSEVTNIYIINLCICMLLI